jgi:hypothetical protein
VGVEESIFHTLHYENIKVTSIIKFHRLILPTNIQEDLEDLANRRYPKECKLEEERKIF